MPTTTQSELDSCLNTLLEPARFKDYCPNGLQVEGRCQISKIVSGVTASQALIEAAIEAKADAILVHHGLFWRGETRVTGWMKKRLATLLAHDISVWAYHLPLDSHPTLGNNAQLAHLLGFVPTGRFGQQDLGWIGHTEVGTLGALCGQIQQTLQSRLTVVGDAQKSVTKVAWCSGGAQQYFEEAIAVGAHVYITGEISEPQAHYAREMNVAYIACGHHASERYGIAALGAHVAQHLGLAHEFIDIDNPA